MKTALHENLESLQNYNFLWEEKHRRELIKEKVYCINCLSEISPCDQDETQICVDCYMRKTYGN